MISYVVRPGDCLASIAYENGFSIDAIWEHPRNKALRELRKDPYTLVPGDEIFIPEKENGLQSCKTGWRHIFRRRDVPEKLRLRFLDEHGRPKAGLPFILIIDGIQHQGTTDADGRIEQWISPTARGGSLDVEGFPEQTLNLGHLLPLSEPGGIRARLSAIGFLTDPENDDPGILRQALRSFQRRNQLPATGEYDEATEAALRDAYGC